MANPEKLLPYVEGKWMHLQFVDRLDTEGMAPRTIEQGEAFLRRNLRSSRATRCTFG